MTNRATLFLQGVLLATVVIVGALTMPAPASAQTCTPTINACGCTISAPGSYKLGLNIDSSQGLTANGACIEITANFVILDGGKKSITGPGGTTPTGIGVWVHHKNRLDFIEFRGSVVSGWDVGLLIEGREIFADDISANTNGTAGVELRNAQDVELTSPTATGNLDYGIWVKHTFSSNITHSTTTTNGNAGIYVGCSDIGPISGVCPGVGPSSGNYIFTGSIAGNTNYGVALDIGVKSSIVTNQTLGGGTHNSKDDLFDANSSCGSNKWFANDSTATNNQVGGCIK